MALKDPQEVWKTTLAQMEIKLDSPAQYKTFFAPTKLIELKDDKAIVAVANGYMSDWLQQRYSTMLRDTISHVYGKQLNLEFIVQADYEKGSLPKLSKQEIEQPLLSMRDGVHHSVAAAISRSGLNDKYTLQSFIVGESNRIAHAAAAAVSDNPGTAYNPLFIHGKTGIGKTHLAQSVGRAILERSPSKKVVYISSESFLNDMTRAIRTNKNEEFRNRYRTVNVLIIDDIQLISKWVQGQTEFFNTFNELYHNSSQIILISDRPPVEIQDLQDRLRSRFQGGIVVEIAEPDYELRLAILEQKSALNSINLPHRILEIIAQGVNGNVRELEGALQSVSLFNQMKPQGDLTVEEVNKIIGNDIGAKRDKVKVPAILKEVAKSFDVKVADLKGPRRTADIAIARQACMYILREEYGYKLEEIAKYLDRNDHTTVLHAVDKIKSMMLATDGFKTQIVAIIRNLNEGAIDRH